ncbi:MAG: replicative DNA helicase [Bacteroidetes bacterium]|nr:replicative DNA helicase [Bacteroidota bacterium]
MEERGSNQNKGSMAEGQINKDQSRGLRRRSTPGSVPDSFFEHGKVPPQAVDLEEAVLGAMMLENDKLAEVIEILKPEVFYKEQHQKIYSAIHRLYGSNQPVDILTVTEDLRQVGELDIVGGAYYITNLTNRVASAANIEFHARIILQKYIQRELIRISSEIIKDAYEDSADVFDLLDKAETGLFSISESSIGKTYMDMQSIIKEAIREITAARGHEGSLRGVGSGFTELDRITSGWQKSDLIIIASRPGMGKTAFALTMARNAAIDFKKPVAVFSLEMSAVQLVTRLISSETEIPQEKLRKGTMEEYEWKQLNVKIKDLLDAPIYLDDTAALSIFDLRAKSRRLKARHNIQLIVVDYLQLMQGGHETKGNREQEISSISRGLKSLAKELDIPVIALSQLSRAPEKRSAAAKPILSDLRESGSIEQDADMVMFIYRPEYYKIDVDEHGDSTSGAAEVSIAKNRNGPLKDIPLKFISKFAKFTDTGQEYTAANNITANTSFDGSVRTRTIMSKMDDNEQPDMPF